MNDALYCDVVSCRVIKNGEKMPPRLFEAPAFSGLADGDNVVVGMHDGKAGAVVCGVSTEPYSNAPFMNGRVLKTIVYTPFDWKSIDEERKEIGIHA